MGEGGLMYWYNPKIRSTEERATPETDEEALNLLDGDLNSEAFVMEYEKLRGAGMDIEQALVFTGHAFRLKHLRYQPPN
jgi:hypothetical protein